MAHRFRMPSACPNSRASCSRPRIRRRATLPVPHSAQYSPGLDSTRLQRWRTAKGYLVGHAPLPRAPIQDRKTVQCGADKAVLLSDGETIPVTDPVSKNATVPSGRNPASLFPPAQRVSPSEVSPREVSSPSIRRKASPGDFASRFCSRVPPPRQHKGGPGDG